MKQSFPIYFGCSSPYKVTENTRFFISSLRPNSKQILDGVRQHWGIEKSFHWILEVTFREGQSRIRTDEPPENRYLLKTQQVISR